MTSFFTVNKIASAEQREAYLLAVLPLKTYKTIEELTVPDVSEDVLYEELVRNWKRWK